MRAFCAAATLLAPAPACPASIERFKKGLKGSKKMNHRNLRRSCNPIRALTALLLSSASAVCGRCIGPTQASKTTCNVAS